MSDTSCPLCSSQEISDFHKDRSREYLRCETCRLIFVPREYHVSPADEKAEYDLHENSPDDPGYRKFLGRLFEPINDRLAAGSSGLDFGSGPGPTLSVMFEEVGHNVSIYDPFYSPDETPLSRQYDFVTASEVVEHFRNPAETLQRLWSCVKPGGLLGIMTKLALDKASFANWHYKNDPTHVSFFSRETFNWLAELWRARLTVVGSDVILFAKPEST
ncbi:MAG: class I SAM-dependent methyltransferase [Planctomycetales bacterium]